MQSIQSSLVKGATAVTKLVEELAQLVNRPGKVDLQKVLDLGTDSLALLGNTNRLLNFRRRDLMKTDLKQDYLHLCSSTVPFTDYLFGDDVTTRMKDNQEVNKAGHSIGWQSRGASRGR